jgi:hypothetical protein
VIYITACLERINNSSGMGCLYENAIPSLTQHEGGHGGVVTTVKQQKKGRIYNLDEYL